MAIIWRLVKITAVKKVCEECETDLKDRFKELVEDEFDEKELKALYGINYELSLFEEYSE